MAVTVRTGLGKRIRRFAQNLALRLGGWSALSELQVAAVRRAAELAILAQDARRRALTDDPSVTLDDLVRLDAAADRALRRLSMPIGEKPRAVPLRERLMAELVGGVIAPDSDSVAPDRAEVAPTANKRTDEAVAPRGGHDVGSGDTPEHADENNESGNV